MSTQNLTVTDEDFQRTCSHLPAQVSGYKFHIVLIYQNKINKQVSILIKNVKSQENGYLNGCKNEKNNHLEQSLPILRFEKQPYARIPIMINYLLNTFQLETSVLATISEYHYLPDNTNNFTFLLEAKSQKFEISDSTNLEWLNIEQFEKQTTFEDKQQQEVVLTWVKEIAEEKFSPLRAPWATLGWSNGARNWVETSLSNLGYQILKAPIEYEASSISCIWKIETAKEEIINGKKETIKETIFFKAALKMLGPEPTLTYILSGLCPLSVPQTIALNPNLPGMLMREFKAKPLSCFLKQPEKWRSASSAFAKFQIQLIPNIDLLEAIQVPVVTLDKIINDLQIVLQDPIIQQTSLALTNDQVNELNSLLPFIKETTEKLKVLNIPLSLDHGDLYPANISTQTPPLFFDWAEAQITHPWFSLVPLLREIHRYQINPDDILDPYFEEWKNAGFIDSIEQAKNDYWQLIHLIGCFAQCTKFFQMLKQMEPRSRFNDSPSVPLWLSLFLKRYHHHNQHQN
eukprot:TRINITY_DN3654_c0_g1_i1.p1 TRINITY_DN3654_c0_g1~~TRINITY_DN3654_c0_g1_i1.p1  ORF type:complete len:516 (-),score=233.83 TRINITY_DN3654_c0_g1_i1:31-1578(-)